MQKNVRVQHPVPGEEILVVCKGVRDRTKGSAVENHWVHSLLGESLMHVLHFHEDYEGTWTFSGHTGTSDSPWTDAKATRLWAENLQLKRSGKQQLTETSSNWSQACDLQCSVLLMIPSAVAQLCFVSGRKEKSRDALDLKDLGISRNNNSIL